MGNVKIKKRVQIEQEKQKRQQEKTERQEARDALAQRLRATKPSQADINELVMMLAREHGLIE